MSGLIVIKWKTSGIVYQFNNDIKPSIYAMNVDVINMELIFSLGNFLQRISLFFFFFHIPCTNIFSSRHADVVHILYPCFVYFLTYADVVHIFSSRHANIFCTITNLFNLIF